MNLVWKKTCDFSGDVFSQKEIPESNGTIPMSFFGQLFVEPLSQEGADSGWMESE